jgi:hypothetical protein
MSGKETFLGILAQPDGHFTADDYSPTKVDRCREPKRHIGRKKDALALVCVEHEAQTPEPSKSLKHVRWGLGQ